jgi:hypothetical protein
VTMVAADSRPKAGTGNGRPLWVDLASVITGERLDRRAARVLAIALAAVATAAAVLLITHQGTHPHHTTLH